MASRTRRTIALAVLPIIALTVSCDGDGEIGNGGSLDITLPGTDAPEPAPEPTDAPEPAPEPTDAPAPEPTDAPAPEPTDAPDTDTTDPADGDDGDGISTTLLVVLGVLALGVVIAIILAATRRGGSKAQAEDPRQRAVSTARWLHDTLSIEILALPAADAQARWATERVRFDQLVIDLRATAPAQRSPAVWDQLAVAVGELEASLDSAVRVRSAPDVDPALASESVAIANARRGDLQRALMAAQQQL